MNVLINKSELFVTSFDMNKIYDLFRVPGLFSASVEFSSSLSPLSDGEKIATISVSPDGLSGSLESILGDSFGGFTAGRIFDYENMIDNMAASIAGAIQLSLKGSGTNAEL